MAYSELSIIKLSSQKTKHELSIIPFFLFFSITQLLRIISTNLFEDLSENFLN